MIKPGIADNEKERLAALKSYELMDTLPSQEFDDITALAAIICQVPIAVITLIDDKRSWLKSTLGIDVKEAPREYAVCSHTILQGIPLVVNDLAKDERFHDNPYVQGGLRFYAGTPLITPGGYHVGTLCVLDAQPRTLTPQQIDALTALARQVVSQLELHKKMIQMQKLNAEVIQAERKAWAAYNVKAEFLANMSHEIRTPLNGIIGMADLLLESKLESDQSRKVEVLQSCGSSLLALINDILDFSKLEAGKVELESIPVDLPRLIQDTAELFRPLSVTKGLDFSIRAPQNMPLILGDLHRLRQILNNLIGNALKFTDHGKITVALNMQNQRDGVMIQFSVTDTGIGIPEHAKEKVFRSFSQVDASTTRQRGGSGLGLAISNGISHLMGGRMWFESQFGVGSTFYLAFKAPVATAQIRPKAAEPEFAIRNPEAVSILVAEDNATNRMVILGYLERFGLQADTAANGREALDRLKNRRYDLVFMDCQMPVMDGYEATQEIIKALPNKENRPAIIALTANAREEDRKKCFAVGMDDHLSKPFKLTDLKRVLADHLGHERCGLPEKVAA